MVLLYRWRNADQTAQALWQCSTCKGMGYLKSRIRNLQYAAEQECGECEGAGWTGVDVSLPVNLRPGSFEKQAILQMRYQMGITLQVEGDGDSGAPYGTMPIDSGGHNSPTHYYERMMPESNKGELACL